MSSPKKLCLSAGYFLMLSAVIMLLFGSIGFQRDGPTMKSVTYVKDTMASIDGGPWQKVTLPHTFRDLEPHTPVTLTAVIRPMYDDGVYVKTVYSPAKIYFDNRLVFEFGKRENYPDFMIDPATEVHIIETHGSAEDMQLRMEFLSPVSRDSLTVHPPMVGTSKELIMERSRMLGIPFIFSVAQIVGGITLILISTFICFIDKKGILFLWMGLFSLSTGAWVFGENNFSSVIFRSSTLLYLLAFIGLFTFISPLLRFARAIVDFKDPRPLWWMELFFTSSAGIALTLQLLGLVSCSRSMYFFHFTLPAALLFLAILTIREYILYKNLNARRFILPSSVLALSAFFELINYQFSFTYVFSSLFQMGILIFLLIMGILAGITVKDSIDLQNRTKELSFEKGLMDIQIKEQKERGLLLTQKEQMLRQQRHDLRHHLTVIQQMAAEDNLQLQKYLQDIMHQIPTSEEVFCENRTVNAVISHYAAICQNQGIDLALHLIVPPCRSGITDSDLCIIFGNLLENAVEACARMTEGRRFIRLNTSLQYDLLTITMDNSFTGNVRTENGRFRSSKRDDFGIGLASVRSVVQKAGGDVEFRADGNVFLSSAYVKL